jgi:hypothetical protein
LLHAFVYVSFLSIFLYKSPKLIYVKGIKVTKPPLRHRVSC